MEQLELQPELTGIDSLKEQLQEVIKPYVQEQNRRQKKADFLTKCMRAVEKNDFFQLDDLLRSKQTWEIIEDPDFAGCDAIFKELQTFANTQIENNRLHFNNSLLQLAKEAGFPLKIENSRFFFFKGIEGEFNFAARTTTINQLTIKSIDPKRIVATAIKLKADLYDSAFDPQTFINSLLHCYKELLKKLGPAANNAVPLQDLYNDYVWSLQSKTFLQNMDKGKFKGYSIELFAVHLWRFFQSDVTSAQGGYRIKLASGRGKAFWLIDHDGEKRQITNVSFIKN